MQVVDTDQLQDFSTHTWGWLNAQDRLSIQVRHRQAGLKQPENQLYYVLETIRKRTAYAQLDGPLYKESLIAVAAYAKLLCRTPQENIEDRTKLQAAERLGDFQYLIDMLLPKYDHEKLKLTPVEAERMVAPLQKEIQSKLVGVTQAWMKSQIIEQGRKGR